jgi:aminopeptidase N
MQPLFSQYLNGDMDYFSWLHRLRLMVHNRHPIVSGSSKTEEQVYDEKAGPGQDIYNKGALMLHSLRELIGDKDFFDSIRRLVYGRPDPKPGNFSPLYATTGDYVAIVDEVTGRDLHWFFDVYLRDAALPRLDQQRDGNTLRLHWVTEHGKPFPMPIEVQVGDTVHTLPMSDGSGQLAVPAGSLLIVDPRSKVLREMPHIGAYQQWMKQQRAARAARK